MLFYGDGLFGKFCLSSVVMPPLLTRGLFWYPLLIRRSRLDKNKTILSSFKHDSRLKINQVTISRNFSYVVLPRLTSLQMIRGGGVGGKFLMKLWCCVGGERGVKEESLVLPT